jgi:hypothetical protein
MQEFTAEEFHGVPLFDPQSTECADQALDQINFFDFRRPMAPLLPFSL